MSLKSINKISEMVSVALLREILEYNPDTGALTWLERPASHFPKGRPSPEAAAARWNGKYAGKPAAKSKCPRGYLRGATAGMSFYAHRAAIAISTGEWPCGEVDHVNWDKSDNRLENLRVVTHRENRLNTKDCWSLSGIYRGKGNSWRVQVSELGRAKHIGSFSCFCQAFAARKAVQS